MGGTNITLAELVDHVIGIDPDRDWITAAIVEAKTTRLIETARFSPDRNGYAQALSWAEQHTTAGERVWAIEGAASYGRGLTAALARGDEWVVEFDWARQKASKDGAKSDELDAIRSAREVLGCDHALVELLNEVAPQLLGEVGIGPVSATTFLLAWSHHGRCRNEAAFARLAGAAPLPATSGQDQNRHRLNYGGDRRINSALYMVAVTRLGRDPATRAYMERRLAEGKTKREITAASSATSHAASGDSSNTPHPANSSLDKH